MKNPLKKEFVKKFGIIGISASLMLLGPYGLAHNTAGNEVHLGYINQQKGQNQRFASESFWGIVYEGDYDSNPDLDFTIKSQERPGQNYLVNDICNQPYESIWVHRDYDEKDERVVEVIEKVRSEINRLHKEGRNRVVVFGRYSPDPEITQGKFDGFLELTGIITYDKEGNFKTYGIEGVIGGVRGWMPCDEKDITKKVRDK